MNVYFDNAATTPIDPEVLKEMVDVLGGKFGNPSSIHSYGREAKSLIEKARKAVAGYLNASPSEIFFTSGGTEADNMAILSATDTYHIKHVITSRLEHHAVLHSLERSEKAGKVKVSYVKLKKDGHIDLTDMERLLKENPRSLVSLMHANNEIGNLLPIEEVGELCARYDAIFHSDTVQSVCHYPLDLQKIKVHFISGAAHKFHGPKGAGFIYINSNYNIYPFIYGGGQERNMRGGTENVAGIVALSKAMEIAHKEMKAHEAHIQGIKNYMIKKLESGVPGIEFNGDAKGRSLYTVLNVMFPPTQDAEMLLMKLDINGIACSAGSACSSGSMKGSHVIEALGKNMDSRPVIRFSFSKYNTKEEVDFCVDKLVSFFKQPVSA
ncbi:MAG: cysteine desulfurase family protein [Bacteroidia bacterium]